MHDGMSVWETRDNVRPNSNSLVFHQVSDQQDIKQPYSDLLLKNVSFLAVQGGSLLDGALPIRKSNLRSRLRSPALLLKTDLLEDNDNSGAVD